MNDLPRVSVITPSFNQGAFLGRTIRSVLDQRHPRIEYVVVDGGSTDNSVEVIRANADRLAWWVSEKDRGQSHAFNKGLARTSGEIIGWLNSDDLYLRGALREGASFLAANPRVDIVFADYVFINAEGIFIRRRKEVPFDLDAYLWTEKCVHANCAALFRRSVFDRIGGLDEDLQYGMDQDFYIKAAVGGCRFAHVHSYWGAYRLHATSKSVAAHDRQLAEGSVVIPRYRGRHSTPSLWARRAFHTCRRVAGKVMIGSYLEDLLGPPQVMK